MLPGELAQAPNRHQLDETNMPLVLDREPREIHDLVVVDAAHDHDVDLDRAETGGLRSLRRPNRIEAEISASDGGNAIRTEAVGGDVDPIESSLAIELRDLGQPNSIGRERDIVDGGNPAEHPDQLIEIGADRRLSAGDTQPAQTHRRQL